MPDRSVILNLWESTEGHHFLRQFQLLSLYSAKKQTNKQTKRLAHDLQITTKWESLTCYKPRGFFQVFSPFIFCHQFSSFFFSHLYMSYMANKYCIVLYCITTKNDGNLVCSITSAAATKIILLATISCQVLSHNCSITSAVLNTF